MAVYDDLNGWQIDQYLGNAEFYMGYGNYDVSLTLPEGWLVSATGTLTNAAQVLSEQTRARLDSASRGSGIIKVVTEGDRLSHLRLAGGDPSDAVLLGDDHLPDLPAAGDEAES